MVGHSRCWGSALPVEPVLDLRRIEAEEMAPLDVGDPLLGHQAPHVTNRDAQAQRHPSMSHNELSPAGLPVRNACVNNHAVRSASATSVRRASLAGTPATA